MIDGKSMRQVLYEKMRTLQGLYDKCDNEYDRLEALLAKRLLSPEPGLEALIAQASEAKDSTVKTLDREMHDLGYLLFTACTLGEVCIMDHVKVIRSTSPPLERDEHEIFLLEE